MNYYNEFDPKAAAWLRKLIAGGLIPDGDVDERSIADVRASELMGYTQCHFFSGIGGWSEALRLAGWTEDKPVWTGSCPCQSFSTAGKQRGFDDERDLWPVFANLIRECRPEYVIGEQVENAIKHGWLDRVYADLEGEGYAVGAVVLGAHSVGAPHRRQRLYWGAAAVADVQRVRGGRRGQGNPAGARPVQVVGLCDAGGVSDGDDELRERNRESGTGRRGEFTNRCGGLGVANCQNIRCKVSKPESGSRFDVAATPGGVPDVDVADCDNARLERRDGGECAAECVIRARGLASLPPWSNYRIIYCRDNKIRRVPAESIFFGVADGVSEGMDGSGVVIVSEDGGFPLTTKKEGRAVLLNGYGNAISPQVAAEFVMAFMGASGGNQGEKEE